VLQQGDPRALPHPSAGFACVLLDGVIGDAARPIDVLREAGRVLRPDGRLLLLEDYDALDARCAAGHPLAQVREWLDEAGFACLRLAPVDVEGAHLLLVRAASERTAAAA